MAEKNIFNQNDSLDVNELAALDEEISTEMIEELQNKLSKNAKEFSGGIVNPELINTENNDASLFEEPVPATEVQQKTEVSNNDNITVENSDDLEQETIEQESLPQADETSESVQEESNSSENQENAELNSSAIEQLASSSNKVKKEDVNLAGNFDDNFIKKYKAKLKKQSKTTDSDEDSGELMARSSQSVADEDNNSPKNDVVFVEETPVNITEKAMTDEQKAYSQSLDFLDGNVKYSKYVIYIDPQNVDFIESLTVKERKNLVNNILKQQGDITVTKQRFKVIQSVLAHLIVTILTICISVPVVYYAINLSLEATIDNYRRSQTNFQVLYREKGKISNLKN